jgi:hypothetical protein
VFTEIRSSKEEPDYAPAASLRVRRRPSPQPPEQLMPTAPGVPRRPKARQVRAASSPDPPGSSWRRIKGMSHAGSSRTPLRSASRTQTIWQCWPVPALSGLLPPSPAPPGSGCPQLHRPAATRSAAEVSHLPSNHSASRRTHGLRHSFVAILVAAGCNVREVSEWAGHNSVAFTLTRYGGLFEDGSDAAVDRLDALLGGALKQSDNVLQLDTRKLR